MPTTLSDVLITEQLALRPRMPKSLELERQALVEIARAMDRNPEPVIKMLCEKALVLCNAGSAGVSTLCKEQGEEAFRWTNISGALAEGTGGRSPRDNSPCGVCLDLGAPQLYSYPERYFGCLQRASAPLVELLVIPLYGAERQPYGAIWVIKHEDDGGFNLEDAFVMSTLGGHMSAALRLLGWFD